MVIGSGFKLNACLNSRQVKKKKEFDFSNKRKCENSHLCKGSDKQIELCFYDLFQTRCSRKNSPIDLSKKLHKLTMK